MKGSHTMSVTVDSDKRKVGNPEWNFVLPYNEARLIVKQHKFKSIREYTEWVKAEKPYGLSTNPYQVYTRRGEWVNSAHYLGKVDTIIPEDKGVEHLPPVKFGKIGKIIAQIFNLRH
jgi:hypothetical protein